MYVSKHKLNEIRHLTVRHLTAIFYFRAFDPCFDEVAEEMSQSESEDSDSANEDPPHDVTITNCDLGDKNSPSKSSNSSAKSSPEKCSNFSAKNAGGKSSPKSDSSTQKFGDNQDDDIDEIKSKIRENENGEDTSYNKSNTNLSSDGKKFASIKFGSPKKFSFSPPSKPPRHLEYSSLLSSSKEKLDSKTKDNKSKSPKDLFSKSKSKRDSVACDKPNTEFDNEAVTENLYVTLPCDKSRLAADSPPPLPASAPPAAIKPRQTMYENVWIERVSPDTEV